jgi:hypothetical protein
MNVPAPGASPPHCRHKTICLNLADPSSPQIDDHCPHLAALDGSFHPEDAEPVHGTWTSNLVAADAVSLALVAEGRGQDFRYKTPHLRLGFEIDGPGGETDPTHLVGVVVFSLEPADLLEEAERRVDDEVNGRVPPDLASNDEE